MRRPRLEVLGPVSTGGAHLRKWLNQYITVILRRQGGGGETRWAKLGTTYALGRSGGFRWCRPPRNRPAARLAFVRPYWRSASSATVAKGWHRSRVVLNLEEPEKHDNQLGSVLGPDGGSKDDDGIHRSTHEVFVLQVQPSGWCRFPVRWPRPSVPPVAAGRRHRTVRTGWRRTATASSYDRPFAAYDGVASLSRCPQTWPLS